MSKKVITEEQTVPKTRKSKGTERKYEDIPELVKLTNSLRNVGITVPNLTNLIKLKAELKGLLEEYNETLKALLEGKYGLEAENGGYSWVEHAKGKEIQADVEQLRKTPVTIKSKLNFLSLKELGTATQNLDLAVIGEIAENLAANE